MKDKNPIDPEKVADNPGLLPYAHHVGSALITPLDQEEMKNTSLKTMVGQADKQMAQIKEQIELLAKQAKEIQNRADISRHIYRAEMKFQPQIGRIYQLYEKQGHLSLSMIAPSEWSGEMPYDRHLATLRLQADQTWDILAGDLD